ncbi:alpha/beta hydrolase [Microbulbifer sp. 2205BS26-8]|uniref:alpha/beta hydrolase n=1 Tax=Microbulbifer sp. 2205BS26-8 TaxID=3064386 RepID=UPI00273E161A|nr:alpha/beta hydrolase [Microbulbifer sp. 2205BS26-8]MDP5208905.1 alpha/beta hydrolase [Microbulbifer sp. 2205BS26-8]
MPTLDPTLAEWLPKIHTLAEQAKAAGIEPTPISAREGLASLTRQFVDAGPDMTIKDFVIPGGAYQVPVRTFLPQQASGGPAIVYVHGGGHMAGSVTVYDPICRRIAEICQRCVVSVEYRRSPENPYPAGLADLNQVLENFAPTLSNRDIAHNSQVILMGDSAGGALCATLCARYQHRADSPILGQILVYPSLDYTMGHQSYTENGRGHLLEVEKIRWYFQNYFSRGEERVQASPLSMPVSTGLPPTLVFTAQFDPLRDEGHAYVEKLRAAGAQAWLHNFDDMIHAFLNLEQLAPSACSTLYQRTADFITQLLSDQ